MTRAPAQLSLLFLFCASLMLFGCTETQTSSLDAISESPHSRCKGAYAGSDCQKLEAQLLRETPEEADARRKRLESERTKNMELVQAQPASPNEPARRWFSPNRSFSHCIPSRSPADRIRMIQEIGKLARVKDLPDGAVEVAEGTSALTEEVWTYYPDERTCMAQLPRSKSVPSRYE